MINMGKNFKTPKRGSKQQWRKVALFASAGIRFHSTGGSGLPAQPVKSLAQAKRVIARLRDTAASGAYNPVRALKR